MSTVELLCKTWKEKFRSRDFPDAEESAERIVAHVLGKKKIMEVSGDLVVNEETQKKIDDLCTQRLEGTAWQFITEECDFKDLSVLSRPPVFVPRLETERLCELMLAGYEPDGSEEAPKKIIELCCGSGVISLFLLKHFPETTCISVDKLPEACDLTMENASRLGLSERIDVLQGDVFQDEFTDQLYGKGPFDLVVSNPPYRFTEEIDTQGSEFIFRLFISRPKVIKRGRVHVTINDLAEIKICRCTLTFHSILSAGVHESEIAYNGGKDGMDFIRRILQITRRLLKPRGYLWFEVRTTHPEKIKEMVSTQPDLELNFISKFKYTTDITRYCKLQRNQ